MTSRRKTIKVPSFTLLLDILISIAFFPASTLVTTSWSNLPFLYRYVHHQDKIFMANIPTSGRQSSFNSCLRYPRSYDSSSSLTFILGHSFCCSFAIHLYSAVFMFYHFEFRCHGSSVALPCKYPKVYFSTINKTKCFCSSTHYY